MSLKEKLSQKSQELEQTKIEQETIAKENELEPIRARIKDLESEKYQLDLVKGSLELKSGNDIGKGMKEYSSDTEQEIKKETTTLDTLMDEHKDVLETAGIENRDQLAENSEFAEEPEVVNYKQAVEKGEDLSLADGSLQKKLEALGVSVDSEHFSYEAAEKAISEKLMTIEDELIKEKIQTPEGREEAVDMLAGQLQEILPKASLSKEQNKEEYKISLRANRGHFEKNILIANGAAKIEGQSYNKLVPEEIKKIEEMYGEEIAHEAVKKAYEKNVDASLEQYDKDHEHVKDMLVELERASPEKAGSAHIAFNEFIRNNAEFASVTRQKFNKITESGGYRTGFKGLDQEVLEDFGRLSSYKGDNEKILAALNNPSDFPPKFDWEKLKEKIEKRTNQNEAFLAAMDQIKTQEDFDHFLTWDQSSNKPREEGTIGKMYKDLIGENKFFDTSEYDEKNGAINPRFYYSFVNHRYYADTLSNEHSKKFKSYGDAVNYYEKELKGFEDLKEKALAKIDSEIEKELLEEKLKNEIKTENFGSDISNIEFKINLIEKDKNAALELMGKLVPLETQIPDDEAVDFSRNEFRVRSVDNQLQELKKSKEQKQNELRSKTYDLEQKKSKKPGLFGSTSKWEKEIETLEEEKKELETSISRMGNEEYRNLYDKYSFPIKFSTSYSGAANLLENEYIQGTKQEVFNIIREKLTEIINRKAPDSVVKLYEQYKEAKK